MTFWSLRKDICILNMYILQVQDMFNKGIEILITVKSMNF